MDAETQTTSRHLLRWLGLLLYGLAVFLAMLPVMFIAEIDRNDPQGVVQDRLTLAAWAILIVWPVALLLATIGFALRPARQSLGGSRQPRSVIVARGLMSAGWYLARFPRAYWIAAPLWLLAVGVFLVLLARASFRDRQQYAASGFLENRDEPNSR